VRQVSVALGDFSSAKLPLSKTKAIQRAIQLFFTVCKAMTYDSTTEGGVKVRYHYFGNIFY
jgi:hypothetical protein